MSQAAFNKEDEESNLHNVPAGSYAGMVQVAVACTDCI